jgi:hypothetical protein
MSANRPIARMGAKRERSTRPAPSIPTGSRTGGSAGPVHGGVQIPTEARQDPDVLAAKSIPPTDVFSTTSSHPQKTSRCSKFRSQKSSENLLPPHQQLTGISPQTPIRFLDIVCYGQTERTTHGITSTHPYRPNRPPHRRGQGHLQPERHHPRTLLRPRRPPA